MKLPLAITAALLAGAAQAAHAHAVARARGEAAGAKGLLAQTRRAAPDEEFAGEADLQAKLVDCGIYDTEEACVEGERRMRCEWLEFYKCQKRETPKIEALSGPECAAKPSMEACQTGIGCVFDSSTGKCYASPTVCAQITCGEERQPPQPLTCLPPLKKKKPE